MGRWIEGLEDQWRALLKTLNLMEIGPMGKRTGHCVHVYPFERRRDIIDRLRRDVLVIPGKFSVTASKRGDEINIIRKSYGDRYATP